MAIMERAKVLILLVLLSLINISFTFQQFFPPSPLISGIKRQVGSTTKPTKPYIQYTMSSETVMGIESTMANEDHMTRDASDVKYLVQTTLKNIFKSKNEKSFEEIVQSSCLILDEVTSRCDEKMKEKKDSVINTSNKMTNHLDEKYSSLAQKALLVAQCLRSLLYHYGPTRGKGRKALVYSIEPLLLIDRTNNETKLCDDSESKLLAISLLVTSLAMTHNITTEEKTSDDEEEQHRAASRAAVSGLLPTGRYQTKKRRLGDGGASKEDAFVKYSSLAQMMNHYGTITSMNLLRYVQNNLDTTVIDLHIVTSFIRAFVSDTTHLIPIASCVVRHKLHLPDDNVFDENSPRPEVSKLDAAAALGLAAEAAPWTDIPPRLLVDVSLSMYLRHAAERLCVSAVESSHCSEEEVFDAVQSLIDGTSEHHLYRQADAYATEFYDYGGKSRYAEARYIHACDTICKVIVKRQFPIVERQVERVDKAFHRIRNDGVVNDEAPMRNGSLEIREFALLQLREANIHDVAHRLASLWDMDYTYDENDVLKYSQARKERYLQWDNVFVNDACVIPEEISCPKALTSAFEKMMQSCKEGECVGFDVEWADDVPGAALLQLSTTSMAILLDVPLLIKSDDGCVALCDTVGKLFHGKYYQRKTDSNKLTSSPPPPPKVVGFSCREDLQRLSSSSKISKQSWFDSYNIPCFKDIKPLIARENDKLKHLGLSRICEFYFDKPLDKSEQCSLWSRRPLSESQRVYAALDAWAVAALWNKIEAR